MTDPTNDPGAPVSDIAYDEWMTDNDAVMWNIERDPYLRSTVCSVWIMDRMPDQDRFENTLNGAVHKIPRLRQRAIEDPLGIAPPKWVEDPNFDPDFHIRHVKCPGDGTVRDLLDYAAPVAMAGFDKDRPLWELHLVDGMEGGRVGAMLKIHHAIADGVGFVEMTASMVETTPDVVRRDWPRWEAAKPLPTTTEHAVDAVRKYVSDTARIVTSVARGMTRGATSAATAPRASAAGLRDTVSSIARMMAPVTEPMSPTLADRSLSSRFDVVTVPLADLKAAGKAAGGTVNDAFVAAIASAMAGYHDAMGDEVPAVRMNMPINIRDENSANHASNHFVPARFEIPLDVDDPAERMRVIHELVAAARTEPAMPYVDGINTGISRLGRTLSVALVGSMMKALDLVTSNVPGPQFTVYSSGARIEQMIPFGPLGGSAVNFTMFTYDGQAAIGINADTAAVTDPVLLSQFVQKGLDEVVATAS